MCGRVRNSLPSRALQAQVITDLHVDNNVHNKDEPGKSSNNNNTDSHLSNTKGKNCDDNSVTSQYFLQQQNGTFKHHSTLHLRVADELVGNVKGWQVANRENLCPGCVVPILLCRQPPGQQHDQCGLSSPVGGFQESTTSKEWWTKDRLHLSASQHSSYKNATSRTASCNTVEQHCFSSAKPCIGNLELDFVRWGLVPSYTKPHDTPNFFHMFNARSETVLTNSVFSRLVERKRCVVPLQGFYEWKKMTFKNNQPYYVHNDLKPNAVKNNSGQRTSLLYVAALYDDWKMTESKNKSTIMRTCTLLTMDSCPKIQWLHDRQPVILPSIEAIWAWLDPKANAHHAWLRVLKFAKSVTDLATHAVTKKMTKIQYRGADASHDVTKSKSSIRNMFAAATTKSQHLPKQAHQWHSEKRKIEPQTSATQSKATQFLPKYMVNAKKIKTPITPPKADCSFRKRTKKSQCLRKLAAASSGTRKLTSFFKLQKHV